MIRLRPLFVAVLGCSAMLATVPVVEAQSSREEWLEHCRAPARDGNARHCEIRDVTIAPTGKLDVHAGQNGGMAITGSDQNQVTIEARIQTRGRTAADAQARARDLRITTTGGTIRVHEGSEAWSSVIFVISTPHRTDIVARAENGPVALSGLEGTIAANVENGPLSLRNLAGDVRANTINGPLAVTLEGSTWRGRGIDATAKNGPITLSIPRGYSAELTAGTVNGPLVSDLPGMNVDWRSDNKTIRTRLGNGGPAVKVSSVNGPALIRVRNSPGTSSL